MNRLKNNLSNNFVTGDCTFFRNRKMTLGSIGLYFYLCSKPQNWDFSIARMAQELENGEKAIQSAAKDLVSAGILLRTPKREGAKFTGWDWVLHPTPEELKIEKDPINRASHGKHSKGAFHDGAVHNRGHKVNSKNQKGKNNNPLIIVPPEINKTAWAEWLEYLKKRTKQKPTQTTLKKQLEMLTGYNQQEQQAMIDLAIMSSWASPYPPKRTTLTPTYSKTLSERNREALEKYESEYLAKIEVQHEQI